MIAPLSRKIQVVELYLFPSFSRTRKKREEGGKREEGSGNNCPP